MLIQKRLTIQRFVSTGKMHKPIASGPGHDYLQRPNGNTLFVGRPGGFIHGVMNSKVQDSTTVMKIAPNPMQMINSMTVIPGRLLLGVILKGAVGPVPLIWGGTFLSGWQTGWGFTPQRINPTLTVHQMVMKKC